MTEAGPSDIREADPETHVQIRTVPKRIGDQHEFSDLADVIHHGSLEMVAAMQRLRVYADEQGTTLGQIKVQWKVYVEADSWKMPDAALPTEGEMHPDLLPGAIVDVKSMWASGVRQVDNDPVNKVLVTSVPKSRVPGENDYSNVVAEVVSLWTPGRPTSAAIEKAVSERVPEGPDRDRIIADLKHYYIRSNKSKVCSKYGNNHSVMGMGVCDECGYSNL